MVKAKLNAEQEQFQMQLQFQEMYAQEEKSYSESTTSDSYNELKNRWFSAEELRKVFEKGAHVCGMSETINHSQSRSTTLT